MAYEQKPNTGAIFKNDKKGNEKAPDYKGSINVEGEDLDIALWLTESKKGEKFFSVKIQEKRKPEPKPEKTLTEGKEDFPFTSDDLPF
jgi:hypothetical protein